MTGTITIVTKKETEIIPSGVAERFDLWISSLMFGILSARKLVGAPRDPYRKSEEVLEGRNMLLLWQAVR